MNKRYVLDAAGVEAVNRAISRVGNTPPAMLDTNRRHRITVTEGNYEPAEEYTGYFKVVNASEYDENGKLTTAKVRIVNGSEHEIMPPVRFRLTTILIQLLPRPSRLTVTQAGKPMFICVSLMRPPRNRRNLFPAVADCRTMV